MINFNVNIFSIIYSELFYSMALIQIKPVFLA